MKSLFFLSFLYGAGSVFVKVISFIVMLWLSSYLAVEEYGNFGFLYSLHQGIVVFAIAGINESTVGFLKKMSSAKERERLLSNSIFVTVPISIVVLIISLFLYLFFFKNQNNTIQFLFYLSTVLSAILLSFSTLQSQLNRLKEDHFGSLIYMYLPLLFVFIGGAIFVYKFKSGQHFFLGSFLSIIVLVLCLMLFFNSKSIKISFGSYTKKIFKNCIPYYLIGVLGWLNGYGNNFIINFFFENIEIATYTFIYTFSGVMLVVSNSINQVWAPKFYNKYSKDNIDVLEKSNNIFYGILALLLGLVVSVILIIYPMIIEIIGGNSVVYANKRLELFLVLSSFIIYTPIWHCRIYFYVNSLGRKLMKVSILSSIFSVINTVFLMYYLGSIGIYIGFFFLTIINLVVIVYYSKREFPINLNWKSVFYGFILSLFTFLLLHYQFSIIYSILCMSIFFFFIVHYIYKNKNILDS